MTEPETTNPEEISTKPKSGINQGMNEKSTGFQAMSLRLKVTLLILVPMTVILALSSVLEYYRHRERALAGMSLIASETSQVIERILQYDMLISDFDRLQGTLNSIGEEESIQTIYLLNTDGKVIFAPKEEGVGQILDYQDEQCLPCHRLPVAERPSGVVVTATDGQSVFRSMQPIENQEGCTQCHDPNQRLVGVLLTDLSIAPIESALGVDLRDNVAWWAGTVIITAVLANLAVNHWVLGRIQNLGAAMGSIAESGLRGGLPETPRDEIGKLSVAFNTMAKQIEKRELENESLSAKLWVRVEERGKLLTRIIDAQEDERKRVARELHDELGQGLGSASLSIELAQREGETDSRSVEKHLDRAQTILSTVTDQMYDLILGLRPSLLDDMGLVAALRSHCQHVLEPTNISFEIETSGLNERLPPLIETALFRICQEALTNILRHSQANRVDFKVACQNGVVEAIICDDGVGFNPSDAQTVDEKGRGLGLLGMRERAEQFCGKLEIESQPGKGTKIRVSIPIDEVNNV